MKFFELMQQLEAHLGYHQIPLNAGATNLKNLFECSPLHHELMMRLTQAIYSGNRCRRLSDNIEHNVTFEAIGPIRLQVLQSPQTDVDLFRLINELCVIVDRSFGPAAPHRTDEDVPPTNAQIIELAPFRRQRRLKTWA
ncbi:MAG: hypothetical protein HY308_13840 [Gammaproteobacteria bacterium]|nr:hypothetical protein [Gammaproteobacteria bacterium]